MKKIMFTLLFGCFFLSPILLYSQDYSLVYGISGVSGIKWETADYNIVDFVSELGISQGEQNSTDYSILPVIGVEEETSSVVDWMLY